MKIFPTEIEKRNRIANKYNKGLAENTNVLTPKLIDKATSVWAQYSILAADKKSRDFIVGHFKKNGVNAAIFYPAPLHLQECFEYLKYKKGDLPITENICDRIFNLPCYGEFTREEQDKVIKILNDALQILYT